MGGTNNEGMKSWILHAIYAHLDRYIRKCATLDDFNKSMFICQ